MSEKMLTFGEFRSTSVVFETEEKYWKNVFDLCRQGMIPAENAVVIPPVGEWPSWAKGIVSVFTDETKEGCEEWPENDGFIHYIPRPKPVWVPRVGEAVFMNMVDYSTVMRVESINGESIELRSQQGIGIGTGLRNLKPFHESHIGKPWDEIPGGV